MDTTQREQFDNEFYNHQEEMKAIKDLMGMVEEVKQALEDMEDMKTNVRNILERYIDEINTLKSELANKR
jgi:predicted nuclease with TOPRIM domain|tara:strand:+ start:62 stop:271 length:210 start_codon:yes stop_codon:yes gene_type:complete